jgi:hypothetical protein
MYRLTITTLLCILCAVFSAYGDRVIEEWGPANSGFLINNAAGTIEITSAGTYYFQSYDGATPTDINWIHVQSGGVARMKGGKCVARLYEPCLRMLCA